MGSSARAVCVTFVLVVSMGLGSWGMLSGENWSYLTARLAKTGGAPSENLSSEYPRTRSIDEYSRQLAYFNNRLEECFGSAKYGAEEERSQLWSAMLQGTLAIDPSEFSGGHLFFGFESQDEFFSIQSFLDQTGLNANAHPDGLEGFIRQVKERSLIQGYESYRDLEASLGLRSSRSEEFLRRVCEESSAYPCDPLGRAKASSRFLEIDANGEASRPPDDLIVKVQDNLTFIQNAAARATEALIDNGIESKKFATELEIYEQSLVKLMSTPEGMVLLFPPLKNRWTLFVRENFSDMQSRLNVGQEYAGGHEFSLEEDREVFKELELRRIRTVREFGVAEIRESGERMRGHIVRSLSRVLGSTQAQESLKSLVRYQPFSLGGTLILYSGYFDETCSAIHNHLADLDSNRKREELIESALQVAALASIPLMAAGGVGIGVSSVLRARTLTGAARVVGGPSAGFLRGSGVLASTSAAGYVAHNSARLEGIAQRSELAMRAWADRTLDVSAVENLWSLDRELQSVYLVLGFDLFSLIPLGILAQYGGVLQRRMVRETVQEVVSNPGLARRLSDLRRRPDLVREADELLLTVSQLGSGDRRLLLALLERGDDNFVRRMLARYRLRPEDLQTCSWAAK